jgi:RNA polymerase sigma factor (sigma-70 family)
MNVHISYRSHKTPDIEKDVHHLIEKLRKRLQTFRPELVHLKGLIEQNSQREGTTVSLNLRLPSGQMAVEHSSPTTSAAVKTAFDDLLHQISKHKDLLRSSHKWHRRRSASSRVEAQVMPELTMLSLSPPAVTSEDIRSYVNANFLRLERFVERELYFREITGQLDPNLVTIKEVVDEAVVRALGDKGERPDRLALEPWLYRLAILAINDLTSQAENSTSGVHLEVSARTQNVSASDEPRLQFHQPDETLTEEDIIADRGAATPEEIAYTDEMIDLIQFALRRTSRPDREAFILHAIEGFSVDEIASITDRNPELIRSSIGAARETLRRSMPKGMRSSDNSYPRTGTA